MSDDDALSALLELAEGVQTEAEWAALLAEQPDLAEQLQIARKVRLLLNQLRADEIAVPAGFEARLFARLRADTALLPLLDLSLAGFGRVLIELIDLIFGLLPQPQPMRM